MTEFWNVVTDTKNENETITNGILASLQKSFDDFQVRAERLSRAYEAMQKDFKKVNIELDAKNAELKKSLAVQEEMQTYLNSILESMDNGVIGVDIAGKITHFNRAATEISGYCTDDVLGKPYADIFLKRDENEAALLRVLQTGKVQSRDEKVIWHKDGHPVPVSFQTAQLADRNGETLGAVEIFSDVSKIKKLEGEMQQSRTMAALGEMSATVAHEIRNPLGAMGMWAGLLERDFSPDDTRGHTLKKIIEGLSRLNKIVSNLLVYTRPIKTELRKVTLESILEEIVDFIEIEIERLGQKVTVNKKWESACRSFVLADPEKIEQVVMNLCLNAIQAMPDGGVLTISIDPFPSKDSAHLSFSIADSGIGIDKCELQKIFTPFYTTKANGTGLGLAIVKKFVEYHSGYIDVSSVPNEGTTFKIFLPKLKE
jgi:PAS domain S-box-containing protein